MAGEKRTKSQEDSLLQGNVIIVDIEGTTTSISFVKDTLFPYVRENVKKYIDAKWEDEEFKRDLDKLKEQVKKDEEDKIEGLVPISGATAEEEKESLAKNILWQMDRDRKTGALKQLQGHMWREAYDSGSIKGHVYDDVPECLKSWTDTGKKIYVYSSGSVEAQKMLFGHSEHGDLLEYFSGYFDTDVGMKQEAASYKNILNQIKAEAANVIFLTDIAKEAQAAEDAGLSSIIMIREGNAPLTDEEREKFRTAKSFLDLPFANTAKRQKLDTPEVPKEEPAAKPDAEKMEISEDIEMPDASDKDSKSKVESNDNNKGESNTAANKPTKDNNVETAPVSETIIEEDEAMEIDGKSEAVKKIDEPIVTNAEPDAEETNETAKEIVGDSEKTKPKPTKEDTKSEEIDKTAAEPEIETDHRREDTVAKSNTDETDKVLLAESNGTQVSERPVNILEQKIEIGAAVVKGVEEESTAKKDAKSVTDIDQTKTETKTEDFEKKSEPTNGTKVEMETENKGEETCLKNIEAEKIEAKGKEGESEKITEPAGEVSMKLEQTPTESDKMSVEETVKENGRENVNELSKIETEIAAAENKNGSNSDSKKTEPEVEATLITESKDSTEKKSTDEKKTEIGIVAEAEKEAGAKDSETIKSGEDKESDKEAAKNDTTEGSKDEQLKKVNGTTQNGKAIAINENEKIRTNGVNEPCTSDSADTKTNADNLPQNGEPESSTESSSESIKVKRVVDSTVADGAGEPDVVPPAVVAATS